MSTIDLIKTTLEIIYFLTAGPILVLVGIKGLKQISVSKEATKINAQREAFRLAAEQCNVFKDSIIPLCRDFNKELVETNNLFFKKFNVVIETKGVELKNIEEIEKDDIDKLNNSKYLSDLLNSLEGYSMYFASGLASEKVGYITTGKFYCETVKKLLPVLVPEFNKGFFNNIFIIFLMWHDRIETEKLKIEKAEIEKKLNSKNAKSIPPIGTT